MSRASKIQARNAELLDRTLHEILKEGGDPVTDREGKVQLDAKGKVVRSRPSAATLNVIRGRIKDLGISSVPVRGSAAGDLIEEARRRGMKFQGKPITPIGPLSEDDDAATGS